jgi:hypothetical protein
VEIRDATSGDPIASAVLPQAVSRLPHHGAGANGADLLDAVIELARSIPSRIVVDNAEVFRTPSSSTPA